MKTVNKTIVKRRQKFLAALESGEFRQTQSRLGDYAGPGGEMTDKLQAFCCMGVGCQVLRIQPEAWDDGYPPVPLADRLGVPSGYSEPDAVPFFDMLAGWNDTQNMTFKAIARRLRQKQFFGPDLDLYVEAFVIDRELVRMKDKEGLT